MTRWFTKDRFLALLGAFCVGVVPAAHAQQPTDDPDVSSLAGYVREALESNLALQQRAIGLRRSRAALREARGAYLPSLSVRARYSRAGGGRKISFPAGDLLNPVYETLNDLTAAQGAAAGFQPVENQDIPFRRDQEQRTRLRLEQPLFAPEIRAGVQARRHEHAAQKAAVEAYRQQLVRDVKTAYFKYLKTKRSVDIYEAAEGLMRENLRTSQKLRSASKVTPDVVMSARAEVLEIEQQAAEAEKDRALARSYFNFLLNRPLDAPINGQLKKASFNVAGLKDTEVKLASLEPGAVAEVPGRSTLMSRGAGERAELDRLSAAVQAAEAQAASARSAFWPRVSVALDVGIQGESYGFTGEHPYYLGSVVLRWNLFNGFRDRARVEQAQLKAERLRRKRQETKRRIQLEVQRAAERLQVTRRSLKAARERARTAREAFRLTARRYEEGMVNQVALLEARTTRTRANLNMNITRCDYLTRLAELEYASGMAGLGAGRNIGGGL